MPDSRIEECPVLVLAPLGKDAALLCGVLERVGIRTGKCTDVLDLLARLEAGADAVMIAEESLGSNAEGLINFVLSQEPWSDMPFLVLTRHGANSALAVRAVETLGNVTLLERPLQQATLLSAVRAAKRASTRQRLLRNHIRERESTARILRKQSDLLARELEIRERMAASLRQSEQLYRGIGESIDFGVWVCDAEGKNTYASDSFLKLVGYTQEEYSALTWADLVHPDDVDSTRAAWISCTQNGQSWDREQRFRGVDGNFHPVLARGVALRDEAGVITGWAGINMDIARMKRAEEQLREVDRRKDEFLATLAHELRNPLAPVRNAVGVLALKGFTDPTVEWARAMIDRQVKQLARLVDDLLDVARISQGKVNLRRERVELVEIIKAAVETATPLIEAAGHRLELTVPAEAIVLDADPVRLSQCVANLLTNAAKYTPSNGQISLVAKLTGRQIDICVTDSGIGIEADALRSIFEMFNQADRSLERAQGGLGIGLTLVRSFVEMHGGTIEARSAGLGKGSQFSLHLPVEATADVIPMPMVGQADTISPKRRVLVVEDNQDSADSIARLLQMVGHEVHCAHDGLSAVVAAEQWRPDLVLLDIGLPRLNGFEVAERLRALSGGDSLHIVALTGWGQDHDRQRSRESGFDLHLTKPVDAQQLFGILSKLQPRATVH